MKNLELITGKEILNNYISMFEPNENWSKSDKNHFSNMFEDWKNRILQKILNNDNLYNEISLNKKSYLGKKTRALVKTLEWKMPNTLNELKKKLKKMHFPLEAECKCGANILDFDGICKLCGTFPDEDGYGIFDK